MPPRRRPCDAPVPPGTRSGGGGAEGCCSDAAYFCRYTPPTRLPGAPVARRLPGSARACAPATARLSRRRRVAAMAALLQCVSPAGLQGCKPSRGSFRAAGAAPAARPVPAWRASLAGSSPAGPLLSASRARALRARRGIAPRASAAAVVAAAAGGDAPKAASAPPAAAATTYTPQVRVGRGAPRARRAGWPHALSRRSVALTRLPRPRRASRIGRISRAAPTQPPRPRRALQLPQPRRRLFGASRNCRGPKPRTKASCSAKRTRR